ncbi:MAG: NAD(+) synthase [Cyclobacteriaceae bacterium]|jgi:NAD+ synthase (glutamine-hydrolysing)|nr:NAD(+) synthase [Flammeovirgaceae bacterium]MCZ8022730.1 NAD(+) synthase [Cytophagales bacterium]MCZ8327545.1 NAD(+) synthase [Cyclobacteriaceae bacterium]
MKLAGASLNQTPIDWENNFYNIVTAIEKAKSQQVELLCLPELCITGYGCEDLFLSDWLADTAFEQLVNLLPFTKNIAVAVGLPIRLHHKTYNGAALLYNQKILGIALKQNLPKDGVHYEPRWFEAWTAGETTKLEKQGFEIHCGDLLFEINGIKIGFEICEDAWVDYDKRPGKNLLKRKVDVILNPSASHFAKGKNKIREHLIINSSSLFKCIYLYVNVLGNEAGRMIYDGDVLIAQQGKLIGLNRRLSFQPLELVVVEATPQQPELAKPTLENDITETNEEIAQAVSLALFDYLRKSKAKGFVLSLSGGADSSSIAVFVAEMVRRGIAELGIEKFCQLLGVPVAHEPNIIVQKIFTTAYQSTENSSDATFQAAKKLAESIGATFYNWSVNDIVNSYSIKVEEALGRALNWQTDDIALQNIQARSRSPIIWMIANIKNALLLTTSNRSEGDVGYATMDGDTSGSLAPIAGLSKPFILQWLKWAESNLGYEGLRFVNALTPTAELRPAEQHQTDEQDLMPYPVLEEIERMAWKDRMSPAEIWHTWKQNGKSETELNYLKKFFRLWAANQWKRERLAPSFHLDDLNVDPRSWLRFPILSGGFKKELTQL